VKDGKLSLYEYQGNAKMAENTIYITQEDANRIRELQRISKYTSYYNSPYLEKLNKELGRAIIVESKNIPPDVITMRSTAALVDIETGEKMIYTLVFPADADLSQGRISILEPVGADMLGYRVGDTFECDTRNGKRRIYVERIIFQPETIGDFN
jgi:regulator of nucleoside diphosphate kinase